MLIAPQKQHQQRHDTQQHVLHKLLPASAYSALVVNLSTAADNYRVLRAAAGKAECSAVLKADGYGLGAAALAGRLYEEGCRKFFVAYTDEGIALRQSFIKRGLNPEIYVLNGFFPGAESLFAEYRLIPTITALEQLHRWRKFAEIRDYEMGIALHVDTGMSRTGLPAKEIITLAQNPQLLSGVKLRMILSQLSYSYNENLTFSTQQKQRFDQALGMLPAAPASFAKSGAIFLGKNYHYDIVRPGIGLHGINPTSEIDNPVVPTASLWARIYQVQDIVGGQSVGYAETFIAASPRRIATLALGYADGFPWNMANKGFVAIGDYKAPIIGRISMDLVTIDVTEVPEHLVHPGGWVEVIGRHLSIQQISGMVGTSPYEVQLNLGARFQRFYIDHPLDTL